MATQPFGGGLMYGNPQKRTSADVQDLRREGGRWLKDLREQAGLSQRELAAKVGAEYYTFISQLETGRGRIPPDRYLQWAGALGIDAKEFVRELMRYYDPLTHGILFGD
jgi:transcriptional regulator with XRE-family HTH domain